MKSNESLGVIRETDLKREGNNPLGAIEQVTLSPSDYEACARIRANNPILHVDHFAFACRDAKETRDFYEGLLGLPLVNAMVLEDDIVNIGATYCHFFFELGDGHLLAFFDHSNMFVGEDFVAPSGFHQHLAFEVASDETVQKFRAKLDAAAVATRFIDHGLYHSLYFTDPNGINLEITYKPEGTAEFEAKSRKIVDQLFDGWLVERDRLRAEGLEAGVSRPGTAVRTARGSHNGLKPSEIKL